MRRFGGPLIACALLAAMILPAIGAAQDEPSTVSTTAPSTTPAATTPAANSPAATTPAATTPAPPSTSTESTPPDAPPNQPPQALLYAQSPATAGKPVAFEAYASSDSDGRIVRYEWDFDGDGAYETDAQASPTFQHTYDQPGTYAVGLRVTDGRGTTGEGSMSLEVQPAPQATATPSGEDRAPAAQDGGEPAPAPADDQWPLGPFPDVISPHADRGSTTASHSSTASARSPDRGASGGASTTASTSAAARTTVLARAAGSASVTISDFKFAPATTTVNVGDTVRWTNAGPTGHSATSTSGAFDTGVLARGGSGSATFNRAGTYAYICTPHPFMKGTIRVLAANGSGSSSGSSGGDSGSGSTTGDTGTAATDTGSGSLPNTGTNSLLVAAIGLGLLLAGGALRLVAHPSR